MEQNQEQNQDKGFTLVELLIVIVILGILATVTVFAVRGITDKGKENACDIEAKTIETAAEAYYAQEGSDPGNITTLNTAGFLKDDPSANWDYTAGTGTTSASVAASAGGKCDGTGTPVVVAFTFGTLAAEQLGTGANVTVIVGGTDAATDWAANAGNTPAAGDQFVFILQSAITNDADAQALFAAVGASTVYMYVNDFTADTFDFGTGSAESVQNGLSVNVLALGVGTDLASII